MFPGQMNALKLNLFFPEQAKAMPRDQDRASSKWENEPFMIIFFLFCSLENCSTRNQSPLRGKTFIYSSRTTLKIHSLNHPLIGLFFNLCIYVPPLRMITSNQMKNIQMN